MNENRKILSSNKKAFHDYLILEHFECGIVLSGTEVKSIRDNQASIKESYARFINNELWLVNCHINPFKQGNRFNPDPLRDRKLLMHKKELNKLIGKAQEKGFTIVPLNLYLSHGLVKLEIGLAKAKKLFDKRQALKEKDQVRDALRGLRARF